MRELTSSNGAVGVELAAKAEGIAVENVSRSFGGVRAVVDVTLTISDKGVTALVGPNGAGKTTLFNIMAGRLAPDRGRVYCFGADVTGLTAPAIAARGVQRTFQDVRLFPELTVAENLYVHCGRGSTAAEKAGARAASLMAELGLAEAAEQRPGELSYGTAKLVALARALMHEPKILLLDEPGAGMDHDSFALLTKAVQDRKDITIVLIEHNLESVRRLADRTVFLGGGEVLADGPTTEVLGRADLAEVYFGRGVQDRAQRSRSTGTTRQEGQ